MLFVAVTSPGHWNESPQFFRECIFDSSNYDRLTVLLTDQPTASRLAYSLGTDIWIPSNTSESRLGWIIPRNTREQKYSVCVMRTHAGKNWWKLIATFPFFSSFHLFVGLRGDGDGMVWYGVDREVWVYGSPGISWRRFSADENEEGLIALRE